ncbi:hypothetical protein LJB87_00300 [Alistipes sp. OttesenSCG-928-L06]|nr:hypothetical protein [Alistipes sp. OttesenSCG-928-L06]
MSTSKDALYQMFVEIKEHLANIDGRLSRLEMQIFEHEEGSFRTALGKYVASVDYSFREFKKADAEIIERLDSLIATQNTKQKKHLFR